MELKHNNYMDGVYTEFSSNRTFMELKQLQDDKSICVMAF